MREFVDGHADQGQCEQGRCAHRIQIRQRIGGGDAAEIESIVHDRHEEIGGRHDGLMFVDLINGGIVGSFPPDQQFHGSRERGNATQKFGQHARRDLAAAAAAVGKRGQARRSGVGICGHGLKSLQGISR